MLLAGNGLATRENLFDAVQAMLAVRNELARSLRSLGIAHERSPTLPAHRKDGQPVEGASAGAGSMPASEMESLLKAADSVKVEQQDLDAFWDQAAALHANKPMGSDVIPYEEARKLGLTPDEK
jgi:hypothetical protein